MDTIWVLRTQDGGETITLPSSMVFVGREECDITIPSNSVDKRHAVITYDHLLNKYKVKDLDSVNGTFINDHRIPNESYVTMEDGDSLRFGYDKCLRIEKAEERPVPKPRRSTTRSPSLEETLNDITSEKSDSQSASLPNSRPQWGKQPVMAECDGCIKEQTLHHTCGGENSELQVEINHSHSVQSLNEQTAHYNTHHGHNQNFHSLHKSTRRSSDNISLPEDPIPENHVPKTHTQGVSQYQTSQYNHEPQSHSSQSPNRLQHGDTLPEINYITGSLKKGTPLYGQPAWWGETGADDHHKQILKEIQKEKDDEKIQKNKLEENIPPAKTPNKTTSDDEINKRISLVDAEKSLSFTVDFKETVTPELTAEAAAAATEPGEKLSNFLPENLRKSFQQRRDKIAAEKHLQQNKANSPASKSPPSHRDPKSYLLDKLLSSDERIEEGDSGTEVLYSEAKHMSRSLTMPEFSHISIDNSDKVSECGTYTIDEENVELNKARADIDELFGVNDLADTSPVNRSPDLITTRAHVGISPPVRDLGPDNDSLEVEFSSNKTGDTLVLPRIPASPPEDQNITSYTTDEEQDIMSTVDHLNNRATVDTINHISHKTEEPVTSKPPISPTSSPSSRRRKLPSIPTTPNTPDSRNMAPRRKKDVESNKEKILQGLGIGGAPVIEKERPQLVEELLTTRTYHNEDDPIVLNKTLFFDKISSSTHEAATVTPNRSDNLPTRSEKKSFHPVRNSTDSINTEILLQSTDEFMKAIHSYSSDEKSSTGINMNNNREKTTTNNQSNNRTTTNNRTTQNNNRATTNSRTTTNNNRNNSTTTKPHNRKSIADSVTQRLSSGAKRSDSRNLDSRGSDDSLSTTSSNTTQSKVKTTPKSLTSTRPNRTFELRRAKAESSDTETTNTPRSTSSTKKTRGSRSNSVERSEVSLGARIVTRSRENGGTSADQKSSSLKRNDGGRFSMRITGTSTGSASSTPKSGGKKTLPRQNSSVASREKEKEAEKAAWDRRRSYDPRRAVAQAKAKKSTSDSRGTTPTEEVDQRPRANSYSGEISDSVPYTPSTPDTRHSADVFSPMESDQLRIQLPKDESLDSSHELEIAKMSSHIAKDIQSLTRADNEIENPTQFTKRENSSPATEELVNSIFASTSQPQRSAFSSYRSLTSATPEMTSPALSPMKKKLSSSQNLHDASPSTVDKSYNNLILTSIQQLTGKLSAFTVNSVARLRDKGASISLSPSPTEEVDEDIPASHELSVILKTLKRVEHNVKVMDKVLFNSAPETELSTVSPNDHEHYLAEIKRIRNEIAGFRPIENTDTKSTEVKKVPPKVSAKPVGSKINIKNKTNGSASTYKRAAYY